MDPILSEDDDSKAGSEEEKLRSLEHTGNVNLNYDAEETGTEGAPGSPDRTHSPDAGSALDPLTGLPRRIAMRRRRASPPKPGTPANGDTVETPTKRERVPPQGELSSEDPSSDEEEDTEQPSSPAGHITQLNVNDSASSGQYTTVAAESTTPAGSPKRPGQLCPETPMRNRTRGVSELSSASTDDRNEDFEEIDANEILERVSQSSETTAGPSRKRPSNSSARRPSRSPERRLAIEERPASAPGKASDIGTLSLDSTIPQTPPSKLYNRRQFVQPRGWNSNFSLKHTLPAVVTQSPPGGSSPGSTPTVSPKRDLTILPGMDEVVNGNNSQISLQSHSTESSPQSNQSSDPESPGNEPSLDAASSHGTYDTRDSPEPRRPHFENFDIWKFKKSKFSRRVSMNSPPSVSSMSTTATEFLRKDPPSPLESDFRYTRDGRELLGGSTSAPLLSRPSLVEILSDNDETETDGVLAPPNSTTINTPALPASRQPLVERTSSVKSRRARSRSDPLTRVVVVEGSDGSQRNLFTPTRVEKVGEIASAPSSSDTERDRGEASKLVESSSGDAAEQPGFQVHEDEPDASADESIDRYFAPWLSALSKTNFRDSTDGHHWSRGDSRDGVYEVEEPESDSDESSQNHRASSGSLHLGDVEVRVQTPNSIRREVPSAMPIEPNLVHTPVPKKRQMIPMLQEEHTQEKAREVMATPHSQTRQYTQMIADLRARINVLETAEKEHAQQNAEHQQAIQSLRSALDTKVTDTINKPLHDRVVELEDLLERERNEHLQDIVAREAKFTHILSERDAEVDHIQAELDEMNNMMPMDQSTRTSRIFEEDQADDWVNEKSREMTTYFDDSIDHLLTEIGGNPEHADLDHAAEEAENCLRDMALEAGYNDLNKASLAAFGIRQLREENGLLRGLYGDSEQRTNQLLQVNDDLGRETDALRAEMQRLDIQNTALQRTIGESRATVDSTRSQVKELQAHLADKTKTLDNATAENKKLDEQIKKLLTELVTVRRAYAQAHAEADKWKSATAQAERQVRDHQQNISQLRNKTEKSNDQSLGLQAQVDAYKQRNSELLRTVETADKARKDQVMDLEQCIEDLQSTKESLGKERDAASASASRSEGRYTEIAATLRGLEEKIATSNSLISTLNTEKSNLEKIVQKTEADANQVRSRYNVLQHESTEKEHIWNMIKDDLQSEIEQKSKELHHSIEPYDRALARIAAVVDEIAPEYEAGEEMFEKLAEQLEGEDIANPGAVAGIMVGIKALDSMIDSVDQRRGELEKKNQRLKAAIKKWGADHTREKGRVEQLRKENQELALKLKAEKKQGEEKIMQLILALKG